MFYLVQKQIIPLKYADNHFLQDYNVLILLFLPTISTISNFGTRSPFLSLSITFFVFPNNFIVSGVSNSSL